MEKKEISVESTVELQKSAEPKAQEADVRNQETGLKRQETELKNEAANEGTPKREAMPEVFFQYREYETNLSEVTERVKSHYIAKGNTEASIESMQIYIKPEDFTAYYVINDGIVGKVNLF